jgi:hypothetical protein
LVTGIVEAAADQALHRENGVVRVGDGLALGRLADSRSPSLANATIDGVVRAPSAFSMTFGLPPSITATQLLVVPRSIPITLAIGGNHAMLFEIDPQITPGTAIPMRFRFASGAAFEAEAKTVAAGADDGMAGGMAGMQH